MQFALIFAIFGTVLVAAPPKQRIDFNSERLGPLGLPLAECEKPTRRGVVTGEVSDTVESRGVLVLDLTESPEYDELGFATAAAPAREIKLDCVFRLVKTTANVFTVRVGGPGSDKYEEVREKWALYAITGPC